MKTLYNISISVLITLIIIVGIIRYAPAQWFGFGEFRVGTTVTSLVSTDSLSDFPTTYNANLVAMNAGKMEISTTTLPLVTTMAGLTTVGTIGTGVWQGTDVGVAYGGTGASTLTQFQILMGSSTNAIYPLGSVGTSGQFLTSGGASALPSWTTSAVDQAINYDWTGYHTFTHASTTQLTISGNLWFGSDKIEAIIASTSVWTTSGTWTKPTGAIKIFVQVWGAGGSGGADANNAAGSDIATGGGGGGYNEGWFNASEIGTTETVTIGVGGAGVSGNSAGNAGTNSTFGSLITGYAGGAGIRKDGAGTDVGGGGGGGVFSVGSIGTDGAAGTAGSPAGGFAGAGNGSAGVNSGGGGWKNSGDVSTAGGSSYFGGGGGGAIRGNPATPRAGGVSTLGGNGGASVDGTGVTGTVPGGGGGASLTGTSGAGGNGQVIITTWF